MSTTLTDFINLNEKLLELDCNIPEGLAFIPINIESAKSKSELIQENSVKTIRTLFRNYHIEESRLEKEGDIFKYRQLNYFEWLAPTILVTYSLLTENPHLISIALGVISNYATDFFKGLPSGKKVKIDIIIEQEKKKTYKKLHYEGDAEGLKELADILKDL